MAFPRLPPEILLTITTSYLSPTNDALTLHSLSLTHSFFLQPSRSALFQTIRLARHKKDDGVHPFLCRSLATLLRQSPHIAGYVRKLIIVEGTIRNSWYSDTRLWVSSEDDDLPYILRMVAYGGDDSCHPENWTGIGLRSLEVLGFGRYTMDWRSMHWKLRQALVDVFERGKLEDLRLVGLNHFPLLSLRRNKSLQNMCFGWLQTADVISDASTTRAKDVSFPKTALCGSRPTLKFLDLSFEYNEKQGTALINELIRPNCPVDISRLQHIVINGDQHLNIQRLFEHCQSDLRFLEIRTNQYPIPAPPAHITLEPLSSLHCLSLFVPVIDWEEINPKPFPWLDHLLSTLCILSSPSRKSVSNPYLHNLQLIFDIDQLPLFERIEQTEWSSLNSHFQRLLKYRTHTIAPTVIDGSVVPDIEITIYIFTDLDTMDSPEDAQYISTYHKDPLASYSTTSCHCDDKLRMGGKWGSCSRDGEMDNTSAMRRFLSNFLPVLSSKEGLRSIRVYRTNCESRHKKEWVICRN